MQNRSASTSAFTFSPGFRLFLKIYAAFIGLIGVRRVVESFAVAELYNKDIIQEYVMAKAILNGVNPYLPVPELAGRWISTTKYIELLHPTPHPPIVGVLSLPLALMSYEKAAVVWLFFELACLTVSVWLLMRWWGKPIKPAMVAVAVWVAIGWVPIIEDLWVGQFTLFILVLILGAWLSLREGNDVWGGAMLGGAIALKMAAWPVVVFLILRRRWRSVIAAGGVTVASNLVAIAVLGFDCTKDYYLRVGPLVASIYRLHDANYSAWTLGWRLFAPFGRFFITPPLWESPSLARLFSYIAPLVILSVGLTLALRVRRFDAAFGLLIITSVLVNPVAWPHYLMYTSVPLAFVAQRIKATGKRRNWIYAAVGLAVALSLTHSSLINLASRFAAGETAQGLAIVPFAASLFTLIPMLALCGLIWLVWRLDGLEPNQESRIAGDEIEQGLGSAAGN